MKARFFYILRTALDNSAQTVYNYDSTDLRSVTVTAVTADGVETTYTYDANGNRASQTTGAVTTTYTYNKANLVTGMVNILPNDDGEDVVISEFAYTYYADGNQRTKTETLLGGDPVTTTYTYDGLGRLTGETTGEDSITYTYDANGNRIGMNQNGTVTAYAYDANNRLLSETVNGETTAYTYDANGNTLTAGDKTYTYNDRGQQTGYSNGTTAAAYAYNPSGLRKAKTVGGSTKYFVYNGMNIVYEYSESVADGIAYFYGLNRTHNSEGEIYVYNAHGDVVQLVCDNSVVASYTYDAFGNLTSQIGESDNPFLYCGEYYDAETQTYYLRARYYNPANGRFTQQDAWAFMDASDPLSLNLYTYCCNNPVMYVDPNGHFGVGAILLLGATLLLSASLTSCNANPNNEDVSKTDTAMDEFFDPESPMFIGGYDTYEEAFDAALYDVYSTAFGKNSNEKEHMVYVYSTTIEIGGYGSVERFDYVRPYSDSLFPSDLNNVRDHTEYARGYQILASIHTHPWHNENIIYTDMDYRNYDSYVVDIDRWLYCLSPGQNYAEYTNYGKIDFKELAERIDSRRAK